MRKTAVISIMFITILVLSAVFIVPAIFAIVDEKNAKEHLAFTVVECEVHPIIGDYNHWPSDEDKQNFMDMAGMEEEDYAHFVDNTASYSSATITCSIENNYSKDICVTGAAAESYENMWIYNGVVPESSYKIEKGDTLYPYKFEIIFDHSKDITYYLESSGLYLTGRDSVGYDSLELLLHDLQLYHPKYKFNLLYDPIKIQIKN